MESNDFKKKILSFPIRAIEFFNQIYSSQIPQTMSQA